MKRFMSNYFQDSFKNMVSFFAKEDKMDVKQLEELLNDVKKDLDKE